MKMKRTQSGLILILKLKKRLSLAVLLRTKMSLGIRSKRKRNFIKLGKNKQLKKRTPSIFWCEKSEQKKKRSEES